MKITNSLVEEPCMNDIINLLLLIIKNKKVQIFFFFQGSYKDIAEINEKKKKFAHLYNLNADPMLTGHITHIIENDVEIVIGNGQDKETDLTIRGGRYVQSNLS